MRDQLIGIDVGTSNIKVGVVDGSMRIVALETRSYGVERPEKDWAQIGADTLWDCLMDCLRGIARKHPLDRVRAIGFSCMSPGLVAFGEDGRVLQDPILYMDRRSSEEANWIVQNVGAQRVFETAANNVMPARFPALDAVDQAQASGHLRKDALVRPHQFADVLTDDREMRSTCPTLPTRGSSPPSRERTV